MKPDEPPALCAESARHRPALASLAAPASASTVVLNRFFSTESLPLLNLRDGLADPRSSFDVGKILTLQSSLLDSADLLSVEVIPSVTVAGEFVLTGGLGDPHQTARLNAGLQFAVEDLAAPLGDPLALPLNASFFRFRDCGGAGFSFPCPLPGDAYAFTFFGNPFVLPLLDVLNADGLRFVWRAAFSLECLSSPFLCSASNVATWSGNVDLA